MFSFVQVIVISGQIEFSGLIGTKSGQGIVAVYVCSIMIKFMPLLKFLNVEDDTYKCVVL